MSCLLNRKGLSNNPQAVLVPFQSRLAVCDQRFDEILFRLVEETKVGAPANHVANDIDSRLPHASCHCHRSTLLCRVIKFLFAPEVYLGLQLFRQTSAGVIGSLNTRSSLSQTPRAPAGQYRR